jgi:hypothetical protein
LFGAGLAYVLDSRLRQRLAGRRDTQKQAWSGIVEQEETADGALVRLVREEVERATTQPQAIVVSAADGIVTLGGSVPANELKPLLRRVANLRGIELIENRLEVGQASEPSRTRQ